ncbi:hypothetical protein Peur_007914 [Populus x canadensis]
MVTTGPDFSFKFKRKTCIQTKLLVKPHSDLPTKIVAILVTSVQAAGMRIQQNQNPSASVSATSKTALFVNKHHSSFDIFYSKSLSHVKPLQVNI